MYFLPYSHIILREKKGFGPSVHKVRTSSVCTVGSHVGEAHEKIELITSTYKRKKSSGLVTQACNLMKGEADEFKASLAIVSPRSMDYTVSTFFKQSIKWRKLLRFGISKLSVSSDLHEYIHRSKCFMCYNFKEKHKNVLSITSNRFSLCHQAQLKLLVLLLQSMCWDYSTLVLPRSQGHHNQQTVNCHLWPTQLPKVSSHCGNLEDLISSCQPWHVLSPSCPLL